jgi:hypothetical protein
MLHTAFEPAQVNPASVKCEDGATYYNGAYIDYGEDTTALSQALPFSMSSFSSVSSYMDGHPMEEHPSQSITAEDEGADALMGLFGNIEPISTGPSKSNTRTKTTNGNQNGNSLEAKKAKAAREASEAESEFARALEAEGPMEARMAEAKEVMADTVVAELAEKSQQLEVIESEVKRGNGAAEVQWLRDHLRELQRQGGQEQGRHEREQEQEQEQGMQEEEQDMQEQEQEIWEQEREHELVERAQADWEREQEQRRQEREQRRWEREHGWQQHEQEQERVARLHEDWERESRQHDLFYREQGSWEREQKQRGQERERESRQQEQRKQQREQKLVEREEGIWERERESRQHADSRQPLRIKKDFVGGSSCHQCKSRRNSGDLTYCTSSLRKNKVRTSVIESTFTLCVRK